MIPQGLSSGHRGQNKPNIPDGWRCGLPQNSQGHTGHRPRPRSRFGSHSARCPLESLPLHTARSHRRASLCPQDREGRRARRCLMGSRASGSLSRATGRDLGLPAACETTSSPPVPQSAPVGGGTQSPTCCTRSRAPLPGGSHCPDRVGVAGLCSTPSTTLLKVFPTQLVP